jgi:DNA-binding transcriptional regulator of glucitol operon
VAASYRFAAHPRWLLGHVVVLVAAVGMVLLGRWQLTVSEDKGFSIQNFGYALQWWAFSVAALYIWARVLRDRARSAPSQQSQPVAPEPAPDEPVAYRRYVMPTEVDSAGDPELARYNAYLRSLDRGTNG